MNFFLATTSSYNHPTASPLSNQKVIDHPRLQLGSQPAPPPPPSLTRRPLLDPAARVAPTIGGPLGAAAARPYRLSLRLGLGLLRLLDVVPVEHPPRGALVYSDGEELEVAVGAHAEAHKVLL